MKKHSSKGVLSIIFILIIVLFVVNSQTYKGVFTRELDDFFGKGNWEYIGREDKRTNLYKKRVKIVEDITVTRKGEYSNYIVKYKDDEYKMSTLKNDLSKEVWAVRQIMDIATMGILPEYLYENIILDVYNPDLADIFRVEIGYSNGNPKKDFYSKLDKQDWFKADLVTVENFLTWEEAKKYNFQIYIRTFDYKIEKLSESEKLELYEGYDKLIVKLLETYGDDASFEILIDEDHWVKYKNGVEVK
jgi:hypothetical protein